MRSRRGWRSQLLVEPERGVKDLGSAPLKSQGMLPNIERSAASFDRPLSEPLCLENAQKRPWSYQAEVECLWLTHNDLELPRGTASWQDQGGALVALKLLQFRSHDLKLAAKRVKKFSG